MTNHCWDMKLISMVTIPLYGCVGSGLIANENWGFAVLLGRLLYTRTAGRPFPTVLTNNVSCINEVKPVISEVLIKYLVNSMLGMPIFF